MKKIILIFALGMSSHLTNASQLIIDHPCFNEGILDLAEPVSSNADNVFSFTKKQIEDNKIDAVLADDGIISVLNYVSGDKSLEIISDTKMRAYGWCYSVNGEVPDVMPDQIKLENSDTIKWYLSYSTYDSGNWVDYCVPVKSHPESFQFICK